MKCQRARSKHRFRGIAQMADCRQPQHLKPGCGWRHFQSWQSNYLLVVDARIPTSGVSCTPRLRVCYIGAQARSAVSPFAGRHYRGLGHLRDSRRRHDLWTILCTRWRGQYRVIVTVDGSDYLYRPSLGGRRTSSSALFPTAPSRQSSSRCSAVTGRPRHRATSRWRAGRNLISGLRSLPPALPRRRHANRRSPRPRGVLLIARNSRHPPVV
jgi:hypothetical protein